MAGEGRASRRRSLRWSPIERETRARFGDLIAGMDEVGRGPLAGPVVACAVIMPPNERAIRGVDDSKRVKPSDRERLGVRIRGRALALGVGAASPAEIDRLNIYHATTLAMRRALARLATAPHHVLVDGRPIRTLEAAHTAVVGGDAKCYSVACASIVAKVLRDDLMRRLARRYPGYGWEHNAGYATAAHLQAIDTIGATPHHRRSFCVRQLSLDLDGTYATGEMQSVGCADDCGAHADDDEGLTAPRDRSIVTRDRSVVTREGAEQLIAIASSEDELHAPSTLPFDDARVGGYGGARSPRQTGSTEDAHLNSQTRE